MRFRRPDVSEYDPRFERYMRLVSEEDIVAALTRQQPMTVSAFQQVPESLIDHRYMPGKWTIREVLGHILDTDRIFGFRLCSFGRGDETPLSRADEELYVRNGQFSRHPLAEWIEEYALIRRSNILLISHLPEEAWGRAGIVSGLRITVRALAFFMLAHERHHLNILRERYLAPPPRL